MTQQGKNNTQVNVTPGKQGFQPTIKDTPKPIATPTLPSAARKQQSRTNDPVAVSHDTFRSIPAKKTNRLAAKLTGQPATTENTEKLAQALSDEEDSFDSCEYREEGLRVTVTIQHDDPDYSSFTVRGDNSDPTWRGWSATVDTEGDIGLIPPGHRGAEYRHTTSGGLQGERVWHNHVGRREQPDANLQNLAAHALTTAQHDPTWVRYSRVARALFLVDGLGTKHSDADRQPRFDHALQILNEG